MHIIVMEAFTLTKERGSIEIHLKELLEKDGLSMNKFCRRAEMQRSQLNIICISCRCYDL